MNILECGGVDLDTCCQASKGSLKQRALHNNWLEHKNVSTSGVAINLHACLWSAFCLSIYFDWNILLGKIYMLLNLWRDGQRIRISNERINYSKSNTYNEMFQGWMRLYGGIKTIENQYLFRWRREWVREERFTWRNHSTVHTFRLLVCRILSNFNGFPRHENPKIDRPLAISWHSIHEWII